MNVPRVGEKPHYAIRAQRARMAEFLHKIICRTGECEVCAALRLAIERNEKRS